MKLFFVKDNSLYKIFKTLEKVPRHKTVDIYIEPDHPVFENEWRGKQILDLLEKKEIHARFITKKEKTRRYWAQLNANVVHKQKHPIMQWLHMVYLFFFHIKKFHLHAVEKKNYVFFIVFGVEFLFVLGILYALYILILPSATLYITPKYTVEDITYNFRYYPAEDINYPLYSRYLSIPFYSWSIDYEYEMIISASNLEYIQNPSRGRVRIYNTSDQEYNLVANTRFVTDDGRMFQATRPFTIPAKEWGVVGETIISLQAMENDNEGIIMGSRGNIPTGTRLYVRNLTKSYFTKEIYAEAMESFTGGTTSSTGSIGSGDYQILAQKLHEYISGQKYTIVAQQFPYSDSIFLRIPDLVSYTINDIQIDDSTSNDKPLLKGTVYANMNFSYVTWQDFQNAVNTYTAQRPSDKVEIISVDKNSLTFFNDDIKFVDGVYILPTKISLIQGYDFLQDINGIISTIKRRIISLPEEEARKIILEYPEISTVRIVIRPPWYNSIPRLKSRIMTRIQKTR
jgi:hypothetical protein